MLTEPFFWPREAWIPSPADFKLNTVQGKGTILRPNLGGCCGLLSPSAFTYSSLRMSHPAPQHSPLSNRTGMGSHR
jgi:hypothetical protein